MSSIQSQTHTLLKVKQAQILCYTHNHLREDQGASVLRHHSGSQVHNADVVSGSTRRKNANICRRHASTTFRHAFRRYASRRYVRRYHIDCGRLLILLGRGMPPNMPPNMPFPPPQGMPFPPPFPPNGAAGSPPQGMPFPPPGGMPPGGMQPPFPFPPPNMSIGGAGSPAGPGGFPPPGMPGPGQGGGPPGHGH